MLVELISESFKHVVEPVTRSISVALIAGIAVVVALHSRIHDGLLSSNKPNIKNNPKFPQNDTSFGTVSPVLQER